MTDEVLSTHYQVHIRGFCDPKTQKPTGYFVRMSLTLDEEPIEIREQRFKRTELNKLIMWVNTWIGSNVV